MPRVLITGAGGFLGAHICRKLLGLGYEVYGLGRSVVPRQLEASGVRWLQGDMSDLVFLAAACEGKDTVIHLASSGSPANANVEPFNDFIHGPTLTVALLEACRVKSVPRVIFASSGGTIYGTPDVVPTPEVSPAKPIGIYGTGKHVSEIYLRAFESLYGIECLSLRISNPFGPGQNPMGAQGVVAYALTAALSGKPFTIYGDGENIRDLVYVDDVSEAFASCLSYKGAERTFNVGSGNGVTINQVIMLIDHYLGTESVPKVHKSPRAVDVRTSILDISRSIQELGWSPKVTIEDGLRRTIDYLRNSMKSMH